MRVEAPVEMGNESVVEKAQRTNPNASTGTPARNENTMKSGFYTVTIKFKLNSRIFFLMVPIHFEIDARRVEVIAAMVQILHEVNPDAAFLQLMDIDQK